MPRDLILCVDDEPIVLRSCSVAMAHAGFRVAVAENGAAGLETYLRLKSDIALILADVVMPGMSGLDMAKKIREIDPKLPILVMSGYSDEIIDIHGRNRFPLIRKPFLPEDVIERVRSLLAASDSAPPRGAPG